MATALSFIELANIARMLLLETLLLGVSVPALLSQVCFLSDVTLPVAGVFHVTLPVTCLLQTSLMENIKGI